MSEVVYLDQNMWIKLLQQQKGQISGFGDELDAVVRLSDTGRAIFPLSRFHAVETASYGGGDESINDMFEFMLEISQRYCVAPFDIVKKEEIAQEAHRLIGLDFSIKGKVIGQGLPFMHGGNRYEITANPEEGDGSEMEELLYEWSQGEEFADELLNDDGFREIMGDRRHEEEIAEELEEIRSKNEGEFKSNSHQRKITTLHYLQEEVCPAVKSRVEELLLSEKDASPLIDHDISEETLESEEFALKYMKRFPAVDSYTKLTVSRNLQKSEIEENDLNDIMALSVAIPYCDLVLTENFWASVSSQCDLEDDYGGVVSSDLSEVTNLL